MSPLGGYGGFGRYGAHSAFGMAYHMAEETARSASKRSRRAEHDVDELDARCERLAMLCEAMWTLTKEKVGITDEELIDRINEIDLSDGRLDGRVKEQGPARCHNCNRPVARRHPKCMWCEAPMAQDPFS